MSGLDHVLKWLTAAANNTNIANIGILGTNLVSNFDNAFREAMAEVAGGLITRQVAKAAGSYTPVLTDHNQFWRCTGAVTLNLTAAATLTDGWCLLIRANGGAVTIDPNGAETIDGQTVYTLGDGQMALIVCTGTTFFVEMQGSKGVPMVAQGRLTLESGVPVSTTDQTAKGTLYYTPYLGNNVTLYQNGPGWQTHVFSEISLALALTSGKPYDVFLRNTAGVLALEVVVWTNDTTRASALTRFEGRWCKNSDATGLYVGTIYASGANTTEDSKAKRYVWNMFNRITRVMQNADEATASWNYTLTTIRQANANAANQVDFIIGVDEDIVDCALSVLSGNSTANIRAHAGIGLDSTTIFAGDSLIGGVASAAGAFGEQVARFVGHTAAGKHSLMWLEYSIATGTCTWLGTASPIRPGLRGIVIA